MALDIIFKILGALGLVLITIGVLLKKKKTVDILFIFGGLLLLTYSISIKDPIFIPLQSIFTLAAAYDIFKITRKKKKK